MIESNKKATLSSAKRTQSVLSATLLVVVCITILCVNLLSRNEKFAGWIGTLDRQRCERTNRVYYHRLNFETFDSRLILDELPKADYSNGGVYFIGGSALKTSVKTWELPSKQRELIRNYGVVGSNHSFRFQWLRYLVDFEGLLRASGQKTHLIISAIFTAGRDYFRDYGDRAYFPNFFRMFGLYTYSKKDGIHPISMSRLERFFRIEKMRCSQFVRSNIKRLIRSFQPEKVYKKSLKREIEGLKRHMGSNWRNEMVWEVAAFAQQIDYLLERNVGVTVIYMPIPSAHRDSPYHTVYHEQIAAVCKSKAVKLVDLADFLGDDEFSDGVHPNHLGLKKMDSILMNIARDRLSQIRTLALDHTASGM